MVGDTVRINGRFKFKCLGEFQKRKGETMKAETTK